MITFWAGALALSLLLYVLLDGFDLGVGLLFPFAPGETARRHMLSSISPVWDGNETWLVVAAAVLFAAFPLVYSVVISAFYLPILVMLVSLILRGVAFEFRYKSGSLRWIWDAGFVIGSYLATFVQGTTVGALVAELPIADGRFVGGPLFWLQPLPLLCGLGLCLGYAMMGACWLVGKAEGGTRDFGYRVLPLLGAALMVFLAAAFATSLGRHLQVMHRWIDRPALILFPIVGAAAGAGLIWGRQTRRDNVLFPCGAAIFAAAFGTLAVSFLPYMVPFSITIDEAAAPPSSLTFLFWGAGVVVLPLTLLYTAAVYWIFRGKVADRDDDGQDDVGPGDLPSTAAPVLQAAAASAPSVATSAERLVNAASLGTLAILSLRALLRRRSKV